MPSIKNDRSESQVDLANAEMKSEPVSEQTVDRTFQMLRKTFQPSAEIESLDQYTGPRIYTMAREISDGPKTLLGNEPKAKTAEELASGMDLTVDKYMDMGAMVREQILAKMGGRSEDEFPSLVRGKHNVTDEDTRTVKEILDQAAQAELAIASIGPSVRARMQEAFEGKGLNPANTSYSALNAA